MMMKDNMKVMIYYTNYRGELSTRLIVPISMWFGSNEWHKKPQWIFTAHDLDKGEKREFAMNDIHSWNGKGLLENDR